MQRILIPSIINSGIHLSSRNILIGNYVLSKTVMWNTIYFIGKWSGQPEIFNKFTYGFLPEHMDSHATFFAIDIYILNGFTLWKHLVSSYEVRYVLESSIRLLKILRALRIEDNEHVLVWKLARFEWNYVTEMAWRLLLITLGAEFLNAFMLTIRSYLTITFSTYLSPLTHYLAFNL